MATRIISDDDDTKLYPSIQKCGEEWRRAWVKTSMGFGAWYVKSNHDFISLWHPSLGGQALRVDWEAVESITYG